MQSQFTRINNKVREYHIYNDNFVGSSTSENERKCSGGGLAADTFNFLATKIGRSKRFFGRFVAVLTKTVGATVTSLDDGAVRRAYSTLYT